MKALFDFIDAHASQYVSDLQHLLRQPSVSAQNLGIKETAAMVERSFTEAGGRARLVTMPGAQPVVYAEFDGESGPTLAFYNHYDVQPPDPLDLWRSDPFAAEIRDGRIWARGAGDNKGNLMARIAAVKAYREVHGRLPLPVKFIVEGEEEIGSPHLGHFAEAHQDLVRAAACVWEGGFKDSTGRPVIYCGVKGICYVEIRVSGGRSDLHSMWGSIAPNPMWRLTWALSQLKTPDERIRIPGFYDPVRALTPQDQHVLESIPFEANARAAELGFADFVLGLQGRPLLEKHFFQPTCTICGMGGGYRGPGMKTVLPNAAWAKVDFRLVPDQDPHQVFDQLRGFLETIGCGDFQVTLIAAEHPARTAVDDRLVQASVAVARVLSGADPIIYPVVPGSGPMYALCQRWGIPSCAAPGVSHPAANIHAPNENIYVEDYIQTIKGIGLLMAEYGRRV
jgi:acetylornithine deacetylase/succinyl-diaminopimelate desuccinylase-like protein